MITADDDAAFRLALWRPMKRMPARQNITLFAI